MKTLMRSYGKLYTFIGIWKLLWAAFTWLGAYFFLKQILAWIADKNSSLYDGHMWAIAMLFSGLLSSVSIHQLYLECARVGIQVRAALSGIIYRKSLKIAAVRGGAGEVINFVSADVGKIVQAVTEFHYYWYILLALS